MLSGCTLRAKLSQFHRVLIGRPWHATPRQHRQACAIKTSKAVAAFFVEYCINTWIKSGIGMTKKQTYKHHVCRRATIDYEVHRQVSVVWQPAKPKDDHNGD